VALVGAGGARAHFRAAKEIGCCEGCCAANQIGVERMLHTRERKLCSKERVCMSKGMPPIVTCGGMEGLRLKVREFEVKERRRNNIDLRLGEGSNQLPSEPPWRYSR